MLVITRAGNKENVQRKHQRSEEKEECSIIYMLHHMVVAAWIPQDPYTSHFCGYQHLSVTYSPGRSPKH